MFSGCVGMLIWDDVLQLWEVLWTDWLTDKMVLFIALAVIDAHRDKIMNELNQFDETLRVRSNDAIFICMLISFVLLVH